ncbi:MAG: serine/threonine-protein kinase [Coriobacteriia bacterium]|nr:serine/threonine-protein kinase [Coriobacteriia bacterium]
MASQAPQLPAFEETEEQLILGRYRVLAEAGSGGFGTVQLAWDTRMQRRVAVKVIDLSAVAEQQGYTLDDVNDLPPDALTGLEEARTAAMLNYANIVTVHDFEVQDNFAYLIMEYVDGMTLTELLRVVGDNITVDMVTAIFDGVASALQFAHENQVLHLDIKPDNVMIDHQGQVKVMDFGLARLSSAQGFQSAAGGTIGYMPPEQIMREKLDARCDEWALASLTYEMISGKNPFLANDLSAAIDRIEGAELVLPSLCLEGLPTGIDDVMFYALDPDRFKRYASVEDFADEMDRFLGSAPAGRKQLAACVRTALDDGSTQAAETNKRRRAKIRMGGRAVGAIVRTLSAANVGVLTFAGLTSITTLGGWTNPICWGGTAIAAILAAILPRWASVLGIAAISAALFYGHAFVMGGIVACTGLAWWIGIGRLENSCSIGGLSGGLFGAAGLNQIVPLLCGYLMSPGKAAGSILFASVLAFALACCGSQSLMGWTLPIGTIVGKDIQQSALALITDPIVWIVLGSWLLATVLCAACCNRRTMFWEIIGVVLGMVVLVAGSFIVGWYEADFATSFAPSLVVLVPALIGAAVCLLLVVAVHRLVHDGEVVRGFEGQ